MMRWIFVETLGVDMPAHPQPPETPVEMDVHPYAGVYERVGLRIEVMEKDGKLSARYTPTSALAELALDLPPNDLIPVEPGLFLERNPYMGLYSPVGFTDFEAGRPRYIDSGARIARRVDS